jgi:TPR repeat protein
MKKPNVIAIIILLLAVTLVWTYYVNTPAESSLNRIKVIPPTREKGPKYLPKALEETYREATFGNTQAQLLIGNYFYEDALHDVSREYTKADATEAGFWFSQAAIHGEPVMPEAMGKLADCYQRGFGVEKDYKFSRDLYISAAGRGYKPAFFTAGYFLKAEDPAKALSYFKIAAESGDIDAQHELGICLIDGTGTSKNYKDAIYWLTEAAYGGSIASVMTLGRFHAEDPGIESQIEAYAMYNSVLSFPDYEFSSVSADTRIKIRSIEALLTREQRIQAQNRTAKILAEIVARKEKSKAAKKARK